MRKLIYETLPEEKIVRFAHHLHPLETALGSGRRYREHPVQLIATTTTLLKLTPAPGLGTVVPSFLSIRGRWAGPVTPEVE